MNQLTIANSNQSQLINLVLTNEEISELANRSIETTKKAKKPNTEKNYNSSINKYYNFCNQNNLNSESVGTALIFVQWLIDSKLKYSTVRTIVSACKKIETVGENPFYSKLVIDLVKGFKNIALEDDTKGATEFKAQKKGINEVTKNELIQVYLAHATKEIEDFKLNNPRKAPKRLDKRNQRNKYDSVVDFKTLTMTRNIALLELAYETGLRSSDLLAIQFKNIVDKADHIKINLTESKTSTARNKVIMKSSNAYQALMNWINSIDDHTGFIFKFISNNGTIKNTKTIKIRDKNTLEVIETKEVFIAMTYQTYLNLVKEISELASVNHMNHATHSFRRGRITDLLEHLPIEEVSPKFHSSYAITNDNYNENKSDELSMIRKFNSLKVESNNIDSINIK